MLISCTSNTILEKPDDLIPQNKMEDLLVDLFIASAGEKMGHNHREKNKNAYFNVIYKKYNVDSTRFRKSNYYYTSQIDAYTLIFNNVKKRLVHKKDSILSIIKKNDSIRMTLSEKRNRINKDKKKLENYRFILKSVDSLITSMTKDRDSLANTSIPLTFKTVNLKNTPPYNELAYGNIDTIKYIQDIKQQESEIEVLSLIKKKLHKDEATSEIDEHITLRKDRILNIKHLLKMDTILYFPITNVEKNTRLNYSKADNYTSILNRMNLFFKNEEKYLKEDIKVQDSLYKKLQEATKEINSLYQVNFNN